MAEDFQTKVNTIVEKMVKTEEGNWEVPEDIKKETDEAILFAAMSERRVRDTKADFTRTRQQLKRQESVTEALQEKILNSNIELTKEQKEELTELRNNNPEAWRAKLDTYEQEAKKELKEELKEIAKQVGDKTEVEIRSEQMAAWSESTGIKLDDDIVNNDLPPRMVRELSEGKVTFEQFLDNAGEFLKKTKIIEGTEENEENEPSFTNTAGGAEPTQQAEEGDFNKTYENTLF